MNKRNTATVSLLKVRKTSCALQAVRALVPDCSVGHVLVQRNEEDPEKRPVYYYHKLPPDVEHRQVRADVGARQVATPSD